MRHQRQFERVRLPETALVFAEENGERVGRVAVLGRGGMLVKTARQFAEGSPHQFTLIDDDEKVRCDVVGVVRYIIDEGVGFEFRTLDVDAAVEIGVILGRYYDQANSEAD